MNRSNTSEAAAYSACFEAGLTLNDVPFGLWSKHGLNFQVFTNFNEAKEFET